MAKFQFEIEEVVDEIRNGKTSGEVKLDQVRRVHGMHVWVVEMPDRAILLPEEGGTIDLIRRSSNGQSSEAGRLSNFSANFVKYVLLILFAFGFVVLIFQDARNGTLDFKEYMSITGAFLGGLGAASFSK